MQIECNQRKLVIGEEEQEKEGARRDENGLIVYGKRHPWTEFQRVQ